MSHFAPFMLWTLMPTRALPSVQPQVPSRTEKYTNEITKKNA